MLGWDLLTHLDISLCNQESVNLLTLALHWLTLGTYDGGNNGSHGRSYHKVQGEREGREGKRLTRSCLGSCGPSVAHKSEILINIDSIFQILPASSFSPTTWH